MAFVTENNIVISFAEYSDVLLQDQRLFEVNEGLSDDVVEPFLVRATERILTKLRTSAWWRSYRAESLFMELVEAGDWYDFDNSGTVTSSERTPGLINLKRVR